MVFEDEILIKDATGRFRILRGGKFYDLEETKPRAPTPSSAGIASRIIKDGKIIFEDRLITRLEEIIDAYQKDARDRFETKATLTRDVGAGGMGLSGEKADLMIKLIEEIKKEAPEKKEGAAKAVRRPEAAPERPEAKVASAEPVAAGAAAPRAPEISPGVAEFVFSSADEAEISAHERKMPALTAGLKQVEAAKFISEIIRESGLTLSETNQKKLENILLTHLKDIRDGYETKATLLYAPEPAGLGLPSEQIEKVLSAVRKKISVLEERSKKEEEERTKKAIEGERQRAESGRQEAEEKVKEKIEKRWQEITKRPSPPVFLPSELISPPIALRQKVSVLAPPAPSSVLRPAEDVKMEPQKRGEAAAETAKSESAKTQKTGREDAHAESAPVAGVAVKVGEKPKPLEIFKQVTPLVRRPIPQKETRPRLEDIKYVPKLVGPAEELSEMTLVDFRRLSSDPREAVSRIKEKINLLEKESISKKIAGMKAWQESETAKLYLEISRESLAKGMPANKIIAERVSAGRPTLTHDEYQAIMELNRNLRY